VVSRSTVTRLVVLLERDEYGELQTVLIQAILALSYCPFCGQRLRILPADVLPWKLYSRPVVEWATVEYATFRRSLRAVVWSLLGDRSPAHTTLHRWTEGLGAYALDRKIGEVPCATPAARIRTESQARFPARCVAGEPEVFVPPARYRSSARRERLIAARSFLSLAGRVTATAPPHALTAWQTLVLSWSPLFRISFRSGLRCTSWEHGPAVRAARWRESAPKSEEPP